MRDLYNNVKIMPALTPRRATDNTALTGGWIDRLGFETVLFALALGTIADADATFAVKLQEADASDQSDSADVGTDDYLGTVAGAAFQFDDDNECRKLGYRGNKRYVRFVVTPTGNSGNADLAAVAILGKPTVLPQADQATA